MVSVQVGFRIVIPSARMIAYVKSVSLAVA